MFVGGNVIERNTAPYLAGQISAVEHEDRFDIMIEEQVDVLHHVLDVHVGRPPLDELLRATKCSFMEKAVDVHCESLAWKI